MLVVERRKTELESMRIESLLRLLPKGRQTVLDLGARDGYISQFLVNYFDEVTALDLVQPEIRMERVTGVQGDARDLQYPDNSFDTVVCAEVLEHILPAFLPRVCSEISRVAKYDVVIGTPYRQDTRFGRVTCQNCGAVNPPWGHINKMDEKKILSLFPSLIPVAKEFVGTHKERTNALSALMMNLAGNPWGSIGPGQTCSSCCRELLPASSISIPEKICANVALRLRKIQERLIAPAPIWIHIVFMKTN